MRVANVAESKNVLFAALENKAGAGRDIVALNAGASLYVAGLAQSLAAGVLLAFEMIASGAARAKVEELAVLSRRFSA